MNKKFVLLMFLLLFSSLFVYSNEGKSIYKVDTKGRNLSVYKKDLSDNLILLKEIPYYKYRFMVGYYMTEDYLYFALRDYSLVRMSFKNLEIENTGVKTFVDYSISDDNHFACVTAYSSLLYDDDVYELNTNVPEIYDLKAKKKIKIKGFSPDFLIDDIGISLITRYDNKRNCFIIDYKWDTPIPSFSGYISLKDFTFYRTK